MEKIKLILLFLALILTSCNSDSDLLLQDIDVNAQEKEVAENLKSSYSNKANSSNKAFKVFRVNSSMILDGLENDWDNVPKRKLRMELDLGSPIESKIDLSSYFKILWDDDYLHVFVSVQDQEINLTGTELYERDGVEFYFDGDNSKNVAPGLPTSFPPQAYDTNDDFFRFLPFETSAFAAYEIINTISFEFKIMITNKGYDVEIKMPFSDLPELSSDAGSEFGFEFQVNDNDNNQRQNFLKWNSSLDNSYFDPSTFATAILVNSVAE